MPASSTRPSSPRAARPDPDDAVGVLAAVGGLEHAAIAGFLLGGAALRVPVVLDGVIAGAAALAAARLAPLARDAWIAGHLSPEPGAAVALEALGLVPLVDLGLRLGEGTGALLACRSSRAPHARCATWPRSTARGHEKRGDQA
jgi:nicotinate-nucleotide--dimethylbenzimidazole phosphoribosyltransferase